MSYTKEIDEYRQQAYLLGRYYNIYKADGSYDHRAQELVDNYKEDRDMLLFDLEKIDRLPQLIQYYLTHEDERCAIEKRAYQKALSRESWERRTAEILRAIEISCKEL